MQFRKFSSIENSYRQKYIEYLHKYGLTSGQWVVSEKVHGANFSFWTNGKEVKIAKKSSFLSIDNSFFNSTKVYNSLKDKISLLYQECLKNEKIKSSSGDWITVYGELAGGSYPHEDVPKVRDAKKVQGEIYYNPDNFFYAFDITDAKGSYLPDDLVIHLCEKVGLIYNRSLFKGTFEKCLEYPNDGQTTLPALFGLPPIEDNIMEGVVIKPINPVYGPSGNPRVIIKNKNKKFSEKQKNKSKAPPIVLSESALFLLEELLKLVTKNRLNNIISHEGFIFGKNDYGKLVRLFANDVMKEFIEDFKDDFAALDKKESKALTRNLGRAAANIIRPKWLDIVDVDGEY